MSGMVLKDFKMTPEEIKKLKQHIEDYEMLSGVVDACRQAASLIFGANCTFVDDDVKRLVKLIQELREENQRLREALQPFVDAALNYGDEAPDDQEILPPFEALDDPCGDITVGDLRRARDVMKGGRG